MSAPWDLPGRPVYPTLNEAAVPDITDLRLGLNNARAEIARLHQQVSELKGQNVVLAEQRNEARDLLAHFKAYPEGRPYAILCKRCGSPYPVQLGRDGQWYDTICCCHVEEE